MTKREKTLGLIVSGGVACALIYTMLNSLALAPLRKANAAAHGLSVKIDEARTFNARLGYYKKRLGELRGRTFGENELAARDALESSLMAAARQSGLNTSNDWALRSARGRPKRGAYTEVAWNVTARGKLQHVVNFLYLLDADERLHRISSLNLTRDRRRGDVTVRLKYSGLVLDLKKPPAKSGKKLTPPNLDSPHRVRLAMISARDLFRPYIKRREPRVEPSPRPSEPEQRRPDPPAGPPVETFLRVVSLSQFSTEPLIHVSDVRSNETKIYKVGDKLLGGRIVLVDYRQMPRVDNPKILSGSRVIVRIGSNYWAVELGRTLAQKHRLRQRQLPEQLKVSPAKTPTAKMISVGGQRV